MLLKAFFTIALLTAFGVVLVSEEVSDWIVGKWKAAGITRHDLMKALRDAYNDTLNSVQFGFNERGSIDSFGRRQLYSATSGNFNKEFLTPFAFEKNLSESEFNNFVEGGTEYCQILSTTVDEVLPREEILDINIEDWLISERARYGTEGIQELNEGMESDLIGRVHKVKGIPDLFFAFLKYKHLLSGSMMFFFYETIKSDERICSILTHIDLQRMMKKKSHQHRDQAIRLQAAFEAQLVIFQQCLGPIKDEVSKFEIIDCDNGDMAY